MEDNYKDFPKPLDTWIEEEKEVERVVVDPLTGEKRVEKIPIVQRVKYIHAPIEKRFCPANEHIYKVIDKSRWLFKCTKCGFTRIIYPTSRGVKFAHKRIS